MHPDFALAHNNLGAALLAQGRTDEARVQFREARRLDPDYARPRHNPARPLEQPTTPQGR